MCTLCYGLKLILTLSGPVTLIGLFDLLACNCMEHVAVTHSLDMFLTHCLIARSMTVLGESSGEPPLRSVVTQLSRLRPTSGGCGWLTVDPLNIPVINPMLLSRAVRTY